MEMSIKHTEQKTSNLEQRIRQLEVTNQRLQEDLSLAEEALRAIRSGEVDALVIYADDGEQIFTLEGADHTYRVMIENINEGTAVLDPGGTILYANRRLAEMLGQPLEILLGSTLQPFLFTSDLSAYQAVLQDGASSYHRAEVTFRREDGEALPALLSTSSLAIKGKHSICLVVTDLTEQKRNKAILASERMARSILEQAAEVIVVCDRDGRIIRCSQAALDILSRNPLFQPFDEIFPLKIEDQGNSVGLSLIDTVLQGGSIKGIEVRLILPNQNQKTGSPSLWMLTSATPLRDEQDHIIGAIVTMTDITGRKEAESAFRLSEEKAREDRIHIEIQRRLIEQREQERQQIARDLHDGPIQDLMGNIFLLHQVIQDADAATREDLVKVSQSLQELAGDLRTFSSELRPPLLIQFGLEKAIIAHLENIRVKHPNIQFQFNYQNTGASLSEKLGLTLYRIYQESLNNVIRHAGASQVRIQYTREDHQVMLEIRDNGVGFTPSKDWTEPMRSGHLGLVGMRERAEAVDGTFEVWSQPDKGTVLKVTAQVK